MSTYDDVRTAEPVRNQLEIKWEAIDDLVAADHPARLIERAVSKLNIKKFSKAARAKRSRPGRSLTSPRMLLTLWVYAISRGVGSAREIERRTREDAPFRWIVGHLKPSHDVINDFRVEHGGVFEALLTDLLAVLIQKELIDLDVVAMDGTRVRASTSAPSFRREASRWDCKEQARLHLKAAVTTWRERMKRPETKALYRQRPALAEFGVGVVKDQMGLGRLQVRGLPKVFATLALTALTFNITQHLQNLA